MPALTWWWTLRGRQAGQYELLRQAAGRAVPGSEGWCAAKDFLGYTAGESGDPAAALGHFTELRDTAAQRGPCPALVDGLVGQAGALFQMHQHAEAAGVARQAVAMAREIAYPLGEVSALGNLAVFAVYAGDLDRAARLGRQAWQINAGIPGLIARWCSYVLAGALFEAGELAAARTVCAAALARARGVGDLWNQTGLLSTMVTLDLEAGRLQDAAAHLHEALRLDTRIGKWKEFCHALDWCGLLCAATGRPAEAVTVWAARRAPGAL